MCCCRKNIIFYLKLAHPKIWRPRRGGCLHTCRLCQEPTLSLLSTIGDMVREREMNAKIAYRGIRDESRRGRRRQRRRRRRRRRRKKKGRRRHFGATAWAQAVMAQNVWGLENKEMFKK